jgi:NTE family protein
MLTRGYEERGLCRRANAPLQTINLVLAGSGSHAAFGWGILDKLLEDGRFMIEGIAASGANAMNAAILAHGGMKSSPDRVREDLETLWRQVSRFGAWENAFSPSAADQVLPMAGLLEALVDFGELRRCRSTSLFVQALNASTGQARLFTSRQITLEAILASSCLPSSPPVLVAGEPHWDGSCGGLAILEPLLALATSPDLLIARFSAAGGRKNPADLCETQARVAEIACNTAMERDIRGLAARLPGSGCDWFHSNPHRECTALHVHRIESRNVMSDLPPATRSDVKWSFLTKLRDMGRLATEICLQSDSRELAFGPIIAAPVAPEGRPC